MDVYCKSPLRASEAEASQAEAAARAFADSEIYGPDETYLFPSPGSRARKLGRTLFPVGNLTDVTTRLATRARYGATFHTFYIPRRREELLATLLGFAQREHAIFTQRLDVEAEEKAERKESFFLWQACVAEELAIGDGTWTGEAYMMHTMEEDPAKVLTLFSRAAEPTLADIQLHDDITTALHRVTVYAGRGNCIHEDRKVRARGV